MALSLSRYCKAFFKSRSIEDLIPYESFLNEQTCATKSGSVLACFAVQPVDDECLSPQEKAQICSNLTSAYNLLEPNTRQYQFLFRTRQYEVPDRVTEQHPLAVRELEGRRRIHLAQVARGATIEIYHCIESILPHSGRELMRLSAQDRRQEYRKAVRDLDLLCRAYQISLAELHPRRMDQQDCFGLFYRLLHTGSPWGQVPPLRRATALSRQLRRASVYWDGDGSCLRVGRRPVRVFTLAELPDVSAANLLGEVLSIDADLSLVTSWQPQERIKTRDQLIRLRTLMINLERNGLSTKRALRDDPTLREALLESGVQDDLTEINQLLGQIRRKRHTGTYSLTVLLHGDRLVDLEKPAAEIDKAFRLQSATLHEETGQYAFGNVLPVFFGCMPGNRVLNSLRTTPLRNDHHAELSTVWSADVGEQGMDYANVYETRLGPLHRTSLRYQSVANRTVLGMTRQGKTTFEIDCIGALQVHNPLTRIYDVRGSYESLARYFGGQVLRCSLDEWIIPVNPFDGDSNDVNFREFCFEFCVLLAELGGYEAKYDDLLQLNQKIKGLMFLPPKLRRLKVLVGNIQGDMKFALSRWVEGGQYGKLFDHPEDELRLNDFQVFDFGQVQDGMTHPYLEPLLALLIYRDTRAMMNPALLGRLKHITFDECVSHWRHPRMAEFIKNILQRFQALNGSLSLLTQSPEDFGLLEPFILQNCSSFVFFANPRISDTVLRRFGFDQTRMDVFRDLQPREFLLHGLRPGGDLWKVLRLTLDRYRYWMYTTAPNEVVLRTKVFAEYGQEEGLRKLAAGGMG